VTERVRIDGRTVPEEVLTRQAARIERALEAGAATFFEALTAVALGAFAEAGVEAAVLEVGLGGRFDATNVGQPLVSVVTRIDYDHQEFLGKRLADIAGEKAGIIRGGTALSAAQAPGRWPSSRPGAGRRGALVESRELRVETLASDLAGHRVRLRGPGWAYDDVRLALPGLFQPANAVLAVGAVRVFAEASGLPVTEAAVRAGCAEVRWPGRFQVIPGAAGRPTLVLDGAHNPGGATALAASLRHHFAGRRLALVLGVSADKDRAGILKALAPLAARIYLAPADHPRATPPKELADELPPIEADVVLAGSSGEALERALAEPGIDVICVAGSLFLVADALRWLGARGLVDAV
jgi:dihydrofolate synthase/folylpolyglutamate synthase